MSAPLNLTNRFELLITNSPASLPLVLNEFALSNVSPAAVRSSTNGDDSLLVTVIVKRLAEENALIIQKRLKNVPAVKSARLEHMVN